jgi:hypothetical protein
VQFLPVASDLDAEALEQAFDQVIQIDGGEPVQTRILRAEHLVAIALKVGPPKDHLRIVEFLQAGAVDKALLCALLDRHDLGKVWQEFCNRAVISNPCQLDSTGDDR